MAFYFTLYLAVYLALVHFTIKLFLQLFFKLKKRKLNFSDKLFIYAQVISSLCWILMYLMLNGMNLDVITEEISLVLPVNTAVAYILSLFALLLFNVVAAFISTQLTGIIILPIYMNQDWIIKKLDTDEPDMVMNVANIGIMYGITASSVVAMVLTSAI